MNEAVNNYIYIWTDAEGNFRSKVRHQKGNPTEWSYDGSSTGQATTESSEIILKPVKNYNDPKTQYIYVLCELTTPSGFPVAGDLFSVITSHQQDVLLGNSLRAAFEQEFFIFDTQTQLPYRYTDWSTKDQGEFYCSVGSAGNGFIEPFVRKVYERAISLGLNTTGYNLEVAPAQGEIQIDGPAFTSACDLIMLRYLLWDSLQPYGLYPVFDPKPLGASWNGSGLHTNISTNATMAPYGYEAIKALMKRLEEKHVEWMPLLGEGNEARLTGIHETSSMDRFTWGVGSRAASVRIPYSTEKDNCGYFEDRRPAGNANPFQIIALYADVLSQWKLDAMSIKSFKYM